MESTSLFAGRNYRGKVLLVKHRTEILIPLPVLRILSWPSRSTARLCFVTDICVRFKVSFFMVLALPGTNFSRSVLASLIIWCTSKILIYNLHQLLSFYSFFPLSYEVFFTFLMLPSSHRWELDSTYLTLVIWKFGTPSPSVKEVERGKTTFGRA